MMYIIISAILIIILLIILFGPEVLPLYTNYMIAKPNMKATAYCPIYEKQQWIRLLDIFVLGPFSIFIAYYIYYQYPIEYHKLIAILLLLYGASTIIYNFANYYKNTMQ